MRRRTGEVPLNRLSGGEMDEQADGCMDWRQILTVAWAAEGRWERNPGVEGEGEHLEVGHVAAAAAPGWPGGPREGLVTKLPGEGALALRSPVSLC